MTLKDKVLRSIRTHRLLQPGDRVGAAVSGGADSVALLLLLRDLAKDFGLVLAVLHFNHKLRGADSDEDERFVAALAKQLGLEDDLHIASGDTRALSAERGISIEAAARELRYRFLQAVRDAGVVTKVATAHTMDDQAETVLLRLLRGAGSRGEAAIHPEQRDLGVVRPLLSVRRVEIEAFLRERNQPWREDASNQDVVHFRNRIRHGLLPLLARDYQPAIVGLLARNADIARAEEEYWAAEIARLLPEVTRGERIDCQALLAHPLAVQRRLIRAAAQQRSITLDAPHVDQTLEVARGEHHAVQLPGGWRAERFGKDLRFVLAGRASP